MAEMTAGPRSSRAPRRRTRRWPQSGGLQPPPEPCRVVTGWKCPSAAPPALPAPRAPPWGLPPREVSGTRAWKRMILPYGSTASAWKTGEKRSHLYHLRPPPLALREGDPKYPALLRVTCLSRLPPCLTDRSGEHLHARR